MKRNPLPLFRRTIALFFLITLFCLPLQNAHAWGHHPLITRPALSIMPELADTQPVQVESLEDFLMANEEELEVFLQKQEDYAQGHFEAYAPCPEALRFQATGNRSDVRMRFFHAIRINPDSKVAMFLQFMPGHAPAAQPEVSPAQITTLTDYEELETFANVDIAAGDMVSALEVVATASNEPDYGMDIGLYEDNNTDYGKVYGFGRQPFGNPNLPYGSQAPFHMGFYHEANIINSLAGFIQKTYPAYRLHIYKKLAEFAFGTGHDYWGWRFAGWGLHYLEDLSYPYHSTLLPGVSVGRMLWINLLDMLGASQAKTNAVQLVSNRHLAFENFQKELMYQLAAENRDDHLLLKSLASHPADAEYTPDYLITRVTADSNASAAEVDAAIVKWMPPLLVADPSFELDGSPESGQMLQEVENATGKSGVDHLTKVLAGLFGPMGGYIRTYITDIAKNSRQ